ncbi:class I SAM-dependent methyltransferase [Candidatus Omnitrophota bacterium]
MSTIAKAKKTVVCPTCLSKRTEVVYINKHGYFVHNERPLALTISACEDCQFVFQSSAYTKQYDDTVAREYKLFNKSAYFPFPYRGRKNLETLEFLMRHLPKRENLHILEIGSNRGDLLYLIKERIPSAHILGIDPTPCAHESIPTINSFFNKKLFKNRFDVIILQHTFEHIKYPQKMLKEIEEMLTDEGMVYIEVPDRDNAFKYCVEDFSIDHVNYFNLSSLSKILNTLTICHYDRSTFLKVIAKKFCSESISIQSEVVDIRKSFKQFSSKRESILEHIKEYSSGDKKIVFYGVSFYFRKLFREVIAITGIDKKACYYYDDSFKEPFEECFKLERVKKFDTGSIVVICSTDFEVQRDIEKKLSRHKGLTIVSPWSTVTTT